MTSVQTAEVTSHEVAFAWQVMPISAALGAEISGPDLRKNLDESEIAELRRLLLRYQVLVFRDQPITPAQHVAFARRFGGLEIHPIYKQQDEFPELVTLIANDKDPGQENVYHSDVSWREVPSLGSILRCIECPPVGGDTIWINMARAYEGLPGDIKAMIAKLTAAHDIAPSFSGMMSEEQRQQVKRDFPPTEQPVVIRHPETGKPILYVNQAFTTHFTNYAHCAKDWDNHLGHSRFDNTALLDLLLHQASIPEHQMRLRWQPDTVVFWDNRSTQHYAVQDYFPQRRIMHRATIIGTKHVAA
jgi:taurine dioxygenase